MKISLKIINKKNGFSIDDYIEFPNRFDVCPYEFVGSEVYQYKE